MINILTIADFNAIASGNFIASVLALADTARNEGCMTTFLFPFNYDGTEPNWVEYIRSYGYEVLLYNRNKATNELSQMLLALIEDKQIALIHSHFNGCYSSLLWNKEIHSKAKIIFHDHMDYVADKPFAPQIKAQIKAGKRYREYGIGVISVMKRKSRFYFMADKKWYIPNGISFKRNVTNSLSREEYRKKLGLSEHDRLVLFLGWDIYRKGVDIAIKAVLKCRERDPNILLGIAGLGKNPDSKSLERIQSIVGFDPRVEGVMFLDTEEDMYALHRAADVYLSASRTEAFSYGILEAISQNVPVVVSNISGTKWAREYTKCISFKSENTSKCVEALMQALNIRELPSNHMDIVREYSIDVWCDRVMKVYHDMLTQS